MFLPLSFAQAAPDISPVPGSGAAYLYFPGEAEGRVKLSIVKEFANMLQDRYEVYYTPRNGREILLCSADEDSCEKLLPAGQGRLFIKGFYDPANKLPINMAKFTGSCSTIGARCTLNLKTTGKETVRITTGCNASEYSVIQLGDNNNRPAALCVGLSPDGKSYLLAAHKNIRTEMMPKSSKDKQGFNDAQNGMENTKIMLNKWNNNDARQNRSAAHYCQQLALGQGNLRFDGWYVPAERELNLVLSGWDAANQSFIIPKSTDGYWSSTESTSNSGGGRGSSEPNYRVRTMDWNNNSKRTIDRDSTDLRSVICVYRVSV
ncbi:hypothetical protein AXE65_06370 [Ventosimonas gracilis]|uniref:DUF1566 domain-containing protein n=1 Tax=Ventosimonas gracilis TaxID=1680762 RepID=A0A139SLC8_9GAMM|nr:hypothetical protein AXE65_06370 [Ventosimonas gracilis]